MTITVPVRLAPGGGAGLRELKGLVVYQICDWDLCLNGQAPFQLRLRPRWDELMGQAGYRPLWEFALP